MGAVVLLLTRPFEGLLAGLIPGIVLARRLWRDRRDAAALRRVALPFAGVALAGGMFLGWYQYRVTGSPLRAPYLEYERQYSGAPVFIWQKPGPEPAFQNEAMRDFYREYVLAGSRHTAPLPVVWYQRLRSTTGDYLGGVLAAVALFGVLMRPGRWPLLALAGITLASSAFILCHWFGLHYQAPAAALYLFLALAGARAVFLILPCPLRKFGGFAGALLAAQLVVFARSEVRDGRLDQLRAIPLRARIMDALADAGGRHLVFVRLEKPYDPHLCWVSNDARIAESTVVWAWDRGADENRLLLAALPGRRAVTMTLRGEQITFAEFPSPDPLPQP